MSTHQYQDPELSSKKTSILLAIKRSKSGQDVLRIVDSVFPTWIVDSAKHFDEPMKGLETNWLKVCKMAKTKAKDIVIVDEIVYYQKDGTSGEFSILLNVLDKLTRLGYCIRAKNDLEVCSSCEKVVILSCKVHGWMKEKKKRDDPYSGKCTNCADTKPRNRVVIEPSSELSAQKVSAIMCGKYSTPSPDDDPVP